MEPLQRKNQQGRVDPGFPAFQLDRTRYLAYLLREDIPIVPLYFALNARLLSVTAY